MKSRSTILATLTLLTVFAAMPFRGGGLPVRLQAQAASAPNRAPAPNAQDKPAAQSHEAMMAAMMAADGRLDALVKKMNAATGSAKTDAMAELLTALVQEHHTMHAAMMSDTSMMSNMMGGMGRGRDSGTMMPKK